MRGIRGIGSEASLPLVPGPGFTLVVGRNGSGKSSFAEGAEVLFRGTRPEESSDIVWNKAWRNLHDSTDALVRAELMVEGRPGHVEYSRRWSTNAVDESDAVIKSIGFDGELDPGDLQASCGKHSPFLSHKAVAALLARPSTMHDAFARVLDLGDLNVATQLLTDARKEAEQNDKKFAAETAAFKVELENTSDDRARKAAALMDVKAPDLAAVRMLVINLPPVDSEEGLLRSIASMALPTIDPLQLAAARYVQTQKEYSGAAATDLNVLDRLAELLERAVHLHAEADNDVCPVCNTPGALGGTWSVDAAANASELRSKTQALRTLKAARESARSSLERAVRDLRPVLPPDDPDHVSTQPLRRAAESLANIDLELDGTPSFDLEAAFKAAGESLVAVAAELVENATARLQTSEAAWRSVSPRLAAWCDSFESARHAKKLLSDLKKAEKWMKEVIDDVRDDRFEPIAAEANRLWEMMRSDSNVQLDDVKLGRRNQGLAVTAEADGTETDAFAVMSQGEVNALILSLFLPRASLDSSPFRFVMIDDPVQAMDPSKVEGLARVLSSLAETRQVIVFTHDERLPAAVEALTIPATILRVDRQPKSVVAIADISHPSQRFVDDAGRLCADREVPDTVKYPVTAALCRDAIEAAAARVVRREGMKKRRPLVDVQAELDSARGPFAKVALAFFGDRGRTSDVLKRLVSNKSTFGAGAPDAMKAVGAEVHVQSSMSMKPEELIAAVRLLCAGLESTR